MLSSSLAWGLKKTAGYALDGASGYVESHAEEILSKSQVDERFNKDAALGRLRAMWQKDLESESELESSDDDVILDMTQPSAVSRLLSGLFATREGVACVAQLLLEDLYGMKNLDVRLNTAKEREAVMQELAQRMAARFAATEETEESKQAAEQMTKEAQVLAQTLITEFGRVFAEDANYSVDLTSERGRYSFVNDLMTRLISKQLKSHEKTGPELEGEAGPDLLDILDTQLSLIASEKLGAPELSIDLHGSDGVLRSVLDVVIAAVKQAKPLDENQLNLLDTEAAAKFSCKDKTLNAAKTLAARCVDYLRARAATLPQPPEKRTHHADIALDRALINDWPEERGQALYLGMLRESAQANPVYVNDTLLERYLTSVFLSSFAGAKASLVAQRGKMSLEDFLLKKVSDAGRDLFALREHRDGELPVHPSSVGNAGRHLLHGIFGKQLEGLPMHKDLRGYADQLLSYILPGIDPWLEPQLDGWMSQKALTQAMAQGARLGREFLQSKGEDVYDVIAFGAPKPPADGSAEAAQESRPLPPLNLKNPVDAQLHETAKRLLKKLAGAEGLGLLNPALIASLKDLAGHELLSSLIPAYGQHVDASSPDAAFDVLIEAIAKLVNLPGLLRRSMRVDLAGLEKAEQADWNEDELFSHLIFDRVLAETSAEGAPEEAEVKAEAAADKPAELGLEKELGELLIWFRGLGQDASTLATVLRVISRVVLRYLATAASALARILHLNEAWARARKASGARTERRMRRLASDLANKRILPLRSSEQCSKAIRVCAGTLFAPLRG